MVQIQHSPQVAIIGAGPAGLIAADVLSQAGCSVTLFDAMPSVGRKFLRAGIGGLNLTHAEPLPQFLNRYGAQSPRLRPMLDAFGPEAIRNWAKGLGIDTFVGSSGRVFPCDMKAAPLLRAWLHRLRHQGVIIHSRHRWQGWTEQEQLIIEGPEGTKSLDYEAILLALGGGSWPQLGSDAAWVPLLKARQLPITPLKPANCGFEVEAWSPHLRTHWAGTPLKSVALSLPNHPPRKGECLLTEQGMEGSLIYALSAEIRQHIEQNGQCQLSLDLLPDRRLEQILSTLNQPRGRQSLSSYLKRQFKLDGVKIALLHELTTAEIRSQAPLLAQALKNLPLCFKRPRPLAEAISSAGGLSFEALNEDLMLHHLPGTFCAGEMLDWEAPTGGYLLTACFATGHWAAYGMLRWLSQRALKSQ